MTYEKAVANQWAVAYHRIMYSKENHKPCTCEDCREHLAAIAEEKRAQTASNAQEAVV